MSLSLEQVAKVAKLARLEMSDADLARMQQQLSAILDYIDQLNQLNTDGVEPLAHPHEQALALREDKVTEPDRADEFLALAPESRGGLYLVPKVIE